MHIYVVTLDSLLPFAAFAQQKKLADTLSVRFLHAALSILHLQRRSAVRALRRSFRIAAIRTFYSILTA